MSERFIRIDPLGLCLKSRIGGDCGFLPLGGSFNSSFRSFVLLPLIGNISQFRAAFQRTEVWSRSNASKKASLDAENRSDYGLEIITTRHTSPVIYIRLIRRSFNGPFVGFRGDKDFGE